MYLSSQLATSEAAFSSTPTLNESLVNMIVVNSYESICSALDSQEFGSKKSIEFLYDQWRSLANILNGAILTACNQSNYIKQTFQNEYPKLLKLQNDLWLRLLQLNPLIDRYRYLLQSSSDKSSSNLLAINYTNPANYQSSYELLRKCFLDLENSYLNRSLSQLFDPINLIFSSQSSFLSDKAINKNDLETYMKGVQGQLQTLQYDIFNSNVTVSMSVNKSSSSMSSSSGFSEKIVSNVCKSIR